MFFFIILDFFDLVFYFYCDFVRFFIFCKIVYDFFVFLCNFFYRVYNSCSVCVESFEKMVFVGCFIEFFYGVFVFVNFLVFRDKMFVCEGEDGVVGYIFKNGIV